MAWTAPATVITGDLLTAALWNAQVRDNMLETAPAKGTAAGLVYPNGANSLALLAASGNGGKFLRFNAAANAVEAAAAVVAIQELWHPEIIHGSTATAEAVHVANTAYFIPMRPLMANATITAIITGRLSVQSGNVDVGVYSWDGTTMTRVVSLGSAACPAAAYRLSFNIDDTALTAGTRYYLAIAFDNATAALYYYTLQAETDWTAYSYTKATSFPLPATVTTLANSKTATPFLLGSISGGLTP